MFASVGFCICISFYFVFENLKTIFKLGVEIWAKAVPGWQ